MENNEHPDLNDQNLAELQQKLADEQKARKEAEDAAAAERAAKENAVNELKELRAKKSDSDPLKPAEDVDAKIQAALAAERAKDADRNKQLAFDRFKNEHKDFHQDNDPGGVKFAALLSEFNNFNTSGAVSVEDFSTFLAKAHRLVAPATVADAPVHVTDDAPAPDKSGQPKSTPPSKLTARERELISQLGWTEDRYLDLKKKQPNYVKQLLEG